MNRQRNIYDWLYYGHFKFYYLTVVNSCFQFRYKYELMVNSQKLLKDLFHPFTTLRNNTSSTGKKSRVNIEMESYKCFLQIQLGIDKVYVIVISSNWDSALIRHCPSTGNLYCLHLLLILLISGSVPRSFPVAALENWWQSLLRSSPYLSIISAISGRSLYYWIIVGIQGERQPFNNFCNSQKGFAST